MQHAIYALSMKLHYWHAHAKIIVKVTENGFLHL